MKTYCGKAVLLGVVFLLIGLATPAQSRKGKTMTTAPKLVVTKLKIGDGEAFEVRGKATFTLAAANSDASLAGTITYILPEDARAKIAQITGKPLTQVPPSIVQNDIVGQLQKLTECPVIHLDFPAMDGVALGTTIHFNRFVLDIKEGEQEIAQYVCTIARQVNRGLPYRGAIRRINEIISGEESQ